MANTTAICTSFKSEILQAFHNLGTTVTRAGTGADSLKAALYLTTGSVGAATTAYSATSEVSGTNYTAGGVSVTNAVAPTTSGTTAFWTPSAAIVYSSVTLSTAFDTVLLYNSSQSNRAILSFNFGSTTITAGTLTLNMPTNAAGTALINLS
jgi:2-oxoglutarate dehydrogenase complex dehydrogenase (E1) component-like enzyme